MYLAKQASNYKCSEMYTDVDVYKIAHFLKEFNFL